MRIVVALLCFGSVGAILHPQIAKPSQNTSGPCSSNIYGTGNTVTYSQPCRSSSPSPSPEEIARAMEKATRIRSSFNAERNGPINSMYVVVSLARPVTLQEIQSYAGFIEIVSATGTDDSLTLSFGFLPDISIWNNIDNDQQFQIPAYHALVWSIPQARQLTTKANIIDDLKLFRFDTDRLDRLEAGAIMNVPFPFASIEALNRGVVEIYATQELTDNLQGVSIVVNDFVIFSISAKDITKWSVVPSIKPLGDDQFHQITGAPTGFDKFQLLWAGFSTDRREFQQKECCSVIDLDQTEITIHRMVTDLPHHAGSGESMIGPNEHGWLPKN